MAISTHRKLEPTEVRRFGRGFEQQVTPDLTEIQTAAYAEFLQLAAESTKRKDEGIESVLREIFPVESYDKSLSLDYVRYELGKPRYTPEECRQLRLTYGRPFRVWLRLNKRSRSKKRCIWAICRSCNWQAFDPRWYPAPSRSRHPGCGAAGLPQLARHR